MKLVLIALTLISCGIATGHQDPRQIRISLQFIEVPHAALTDMLAGPAKDSQALHDKAVALSLEGGEFWVFSNIDAYRFTSPILLSK